MQLFIMLGIFGGLFFWFGAVYKLFQVFYRRRKIKNFRMGKKAIKGELIYEGNKLKFIQSDILSLDTVNKINKSEVEDENT